MRKNHKNGLRERALNVVSEISNQRNRLDGEKGVQLGDKVSFYITGNVVVLNLSFCCV